MIFNPEEFYEALDTATRHVQRQTSDFRPRVLVICGSGLGGISSLLSDTIKLPYETIPGFKTSTVPGHDGELQFGYIGSNRVPVMCMVGRLHYYEGYEFEDTTFGVRLAKQLGCDTVYVTNAAGGIRHGFKPGDLMVISDHVFFAGFSGSHPLRGQNLDKLGERFVPLSDAYDHSLRRLFFTTAKKLGITRKIHEGTYFFAAGPTFESRAEVRAIRTLGGDSVGMSTVPEVIVARHAGLKVFALSLITNSCVDQPPAGALEEDPVAMDEGIASHKEVLQYANEASKDVEKIVEEAINSL
jgi:purine-nucleoside phosphorylase